MGTLPGANGRGARGKPTTPSGAETASRDTKEERRRGQKTDLSLLKGSETEELECWPFCLPGECEMINGETKL